MKALTASQLIEALIKKGHGMHSAINIPANKWTADYVKFTEYDNGDSYIILYKNISQYSSTRITSYSKMNAADKKQLASLIL
jgi:hypothetical protein